MKIEFTIPATGLEDKYTLDGNLITWDHLGGGATYVSPAQAEIYFSTGWWQKVEEPSRMYCAGFGVGVNENEADQTSAPEDNTQANTAPSGPIASDGGSSSYYDIDVPGWLLDRIRERYIAGRAYIKTEELVEVAFDSDFDAGNVFKSLVRMWGAFNGAGKAGNSVGYEKKKIEYSVGKLEQRFERQGVAF